MDGDIVNVMGLGAGGGGGGVEGVGMVLVLCTGKSYLGEKKSRPDKYSVVEKGILHRRSSGWNLVVVVDSELRFEDLRSVCLVKRG